MYNNGEVAKRRKTGQTLVVVGRWEQLPNGPLIEIAHRLSNMEDFEVLHLVCRSWYSVLREFQCKFLDGRCTSTTPHVPWLLMADHGGVKIGDGPSSSNLCLRPCSSKGKTMLLYFYRLSFQRIREMVIRIPPELQLDNNCRLYSSHGWLLVARKGSNLSLYNPFYSSTCNYIPLPGPSTLANYVSRFTLSASPCTESYTVMITYEINKVALWRPGDESWTLLHSQPSVEFVGGMNFLDVTFYRGYYYAFNQHGVILRFYAFEDVGHYGSIGAFVDSDNENSRWIHIGILSPPRIYTFHWKAYFLVVDSSSNEEEKLFVVIREGVKPKIESNCFVNNYFITTTGFRVVEIFMCPGEIKVHTKEVISLGNRSLFVGRNQAFAIEIPQEGVNPSDSESKNAAPLGYYGCKPNCIYFTDETDDRLHSPATVECGKCKDMGVFNMVDCSIERRFDGLDGYIPMLWVEPRC